MKRVTLRAKTEIGGGMIFTERAISATFLCVYVCYIGHSCATWPCDVICYILDMLILLRVCVYVYIIYVQYDIKYFV